MQRLLLQELRIGRLMKVHVLKREQVVAADLTSCWDFFSNPANLRTITPPELDFRVLSELPAAVYPGQMIVYRVRPIFGIPVTWLTEITHVDEGRFFCDEQRIGPYRIWHHEHHFEECPEGVLMRDLVHYVLPLSPLSEIFHSSLVLPQLNKIFDFRITTIEKVFARSQVVASS